MRLSDSEITFEKLNQAQELLKRENIDLWLIITREGSDPSLPLITGVRSVHQAVIFLHKNGERRVITSVSDIGSYKSTNLFDEVITYEANINEVFLKVFNEYSPDKVALNISQSDHLCDGLTLGLYLWLEDVLGEKTLGQLEVSSEPILRELRSIKTPKEIVCISEAVRLTNEIYDEVFSKIKVGMTEKQIGQLFVEEMRKRKVENGLGHPFDPPLVCTVRNGLAHRMPGDHEVIPGDIIIIDLSLKYQNYTSDIARTCYVLKDNETKAPEEIQRAFDAAIDAITQSINALRPGKKGYEVDAVGRNCIVSHGYPTIRHSVGHQVGRNTHDGGTVLGPVRIPRRPEVEGKIKVGEIYAIEPTVIQDNGLPCMLVEENVLVTEEGPVLLSKRQEELILIKS